MTTEHAYLSIFLIGVFLTSALFYLVFYFGFSRRAAFLFFSLFCIGYTGKLVFLPEVTFLDFGLRGAPEHAARLFFYYIGGISLVGFLAYEFSLPRRGWVLLATTLLTLGVYLSRIPHALLYVPVSFAIAAYGYRRGSEGSGLALVGLVGLTVMNYLDHVQRIFSEGFFFGMAFFIICMTLSVGRQIAQQLRQRQAALMRSARLENQLLKKSMQPHFIFNSLASLQELIERDPLRASRFVDELADEFRAVSDILGRPLIPLAEELALCRTHLNIMEYRRQAGYTFVTEGVEGNELVPPALFHTLVENAVTHGYAGRATGYLRLCKTVELKGECYTLFNDGDFTDVAKTERGTGLKYVEACLEENFPGRWQLEAGPVESGWLVTIRIQRKQAPAIESEKNAYAAADR